jgi:predicted dehydrogenase
MKRYMLCGASGRGGYYAETLTGISVRDGRSGAPQYAEYAELVGIFDINGMRAEFIRDNCNPEKTIPFYTDFDRCVRETRPDCVFVITMDSSHAEYAARALDAGLDVVCEKPMAIDAAGARAILEAERRNGRRIAVTLNARHQEGRIRMHELLRNGAIGKVLSADFEWMLDRVHGASYFRRWHKWMKNSGGLLLTKATHHFDMANWWIGQDPVSVFARGSLDFYGPGEGRPGGEKCTACPCAKTCDNPWTGFDHAHGSDSDIAWMKKAYFEPSAIDGYTPDSCIYGPTDIYDNMSLSVLYSGGALMTYSLHAFSPYEGFRIAINGTLGRIECSEVHAGLAPQLNYPEDSFTVIYPGDRREVYQFPPKSGAHGGADARMFDRLFIGGQPDPQHTMAGSREGSMSALIGAAANISIASGQAVDVRGLLDVDACM